MALNMKKYQREWRRRRRKEPAYREGMRSYALIYNHKQFAERPAAVLLRRAKYRAKVMGLRFNISLSDIRIPKRCPILGVKLVAKVRHRYAPSLDRVDTRKGYVRGNVRIISRSANMKKNGWTPPQVRRLLAYMEGRV